jgi:hypothetical protein
MLHNKTKPKTELYQQRCCTERARGVRWSKYWNISQYAPRVIVNAIIKGLQGWRSGNDVQFNMRTTAGQLGIAQSEMGWKHGFEGRWHVQWQIAMDKYYKEKGLRRSGKRWLNAIIKKLWAIAWDLWEHRNGIMHNRTKGYETQQLTNPIKELWVHPQLRHIASIRHLVQGEVDAICGRNLHQKQQWVLCITAAIQRHTEQREATQYHQEREGMRQYLNQFQR